MVTEAPETISDELNNPLEADDTAEESPARRRGRPEGAKNKGPDPTFFDRLKDLDWERNVVYIYRTEPLVDLTTGGGPKYATKYAEPFDEDKVMRDLGSGKYQARVSQTQPTTGKGKQTDVYTFEIFNTQFPPQIPVGAWLDDHRNARWKWAKDALAVLPVVGNGTGSSQDVGKQVKEVLQEIRQGQVSPTDQFNAMVKAHQSGITQGVEMSKPGNGGGEVVELLKTLLPAILKQPAQDNSVVQVLTLQLEAEREQRRADREQAKSDRESADRRAEAAEKRHDALLQGLLAKKENSGTDVIEQAGKIFGLVNQIREGSGIGASDESWGGMFKDGIRDAMPDLVRNLAPGVGQMLAGIGTGARPSPPPPQQNVSRETHFASPSPVSRETPPAPQPQQQTQPPPFDPQFGPAYAVIYMNQAALLNAMKTGKTGLDFGDWLASGPGEIEIKKLKAAGVENLVQFIAVQMPELWKELQPVQVELRTFLKDVIEWEPEGEDADPEPALNMPGGTAKQTAKGKKANAGGKQ